MSWSLKSPSAVIMRISTLSIRPRAMRHEREPLMRETQLQCLQKGFHQRERRIETEGIRKNA